MVRTELNAQEFASWIVLSLVILQVGSILLTQLFGLEQLRLGLGFMLVAIGAALVGAFTILKGGLSGADSKTVILFLVGISVVAFILLKLQGIAPQIFSIGLNELQSIAG